MPIELGPERRDPALLSAERAELLKEIDELEAADADPEEIESVRKKLADIEVILANLGEQLPDLVANHEEGE